MQPINLLDIQGNNNLVSFVDSSQINKITVNGNDNFINIDWQTDAIYSDSGSGNTMSSLVTLPKNTL